ncbi:MAG: electron transport complex subunit RsxD [Candidatus Parabeggiatoa sp.]|nr:electron transport complex subunit RsxD [Candidatus Parabeggiatoa sp.]
MLLKTSSAPFLHQETSVSEIMRQVLYALMPGIVVYVYFLGWGIVVNILLASVTALTCEALMLWLRNRPIRPFLTDNSALVTAWLLAMALPPFVPWWVTVLGTAFGLIFAKHLYGGLGYNPFNPAVVGYMVLLISFPLEMTRWPALPSLSGYYPGILDSLSIIFTGQAMGGLTVDALSSATPLDTMKTELAQFYTVAEIQGNPLFSTFAAKGWEWIEGTFFLGGCWLIYKRVITWHIPVAVLGSLFLISGCFFLIDSDLNPSPLFHILTGGSIIGAFFIATDPVSAATSNKGRLFYGVGIGLLIYIIRTWGGYPDGVAFAVLLMNMTVPTIDYYTKPRVFGH